MIFTMMNIGAFYIRTSDQNSQWQLENEDLLKKKKPSKTLDSDLEQVWI